MKLDVDVLRYLSKDDFRVLTAVEMGMRNHEIVPSELIVRIASLKHGGAYKVLKNLLKHKLLHHDSSKYDGFRLTYLGYDFLAIKTLVNRGVFSSVGRQIGVGKESDIFEVANEDGQVMAMKLHRLGRVSFRAVKSKRDYLKHRSSFNWLYLSRLAALKEFAFMKGLEDHEFSVPKAIDCNRHCVVMSLVDGYPLVQVKQLQNPDIVFQEVLQLVIRLAEHGLIHCDLNEFNIMINEDEKVTMIDFPQMVSRYHRNAEMYFDRDVDCIYKFFSQRFNSTPKEHADVPEDSEEDSDEVVKPCLTSIEIVKDLGKELSASGFSRKDQDAIGTFIEGDFDESPSYDDNEFEEVGGQRSGRVFEADVDNFDSLCLLDKDGEFFTGTHNFEVEESQSGAQGNCEPESEDASSEEEETRTGNNTSQDACNQVDDDEQDNSSELGERLARQRRRAIQAARGGKKTSAVSKRNTYKDKGGKSSQNSKNIHKELSSW